MNFHTRICRAIGLRSDDRARIVAHALARVGQDYDLRNVIDLARHRLSWSKAETTPKHQTLPMGGAEPSRTICSTLIAQAFQSVRYPILPKRRLVPCREASTGRSDDCLEEAWEARHFSLIAPRDFDVSPYFNVVKPPPVEDFDYTRLRWAS